jgi:hypothetical protein
MHQPVYEEEGVALVEVQRNSAGEVVHAVTAAVVAGERVREVGFVASGDYHCRAVAFVDVR